MDEHCAAVAHRLEAIAVQIEHLAVRLTALDDGAWVSTAAQRYRDRLAEVAVGLRIGAERAHEASRVVLRHALAVGSVAR